MTDTNAVLATLSAAAYVVGRSEENLINVPDGVVPLPADLGYRSLADSGFEASAFFYDSKIVIAYAGTLVPSIADGLTSEDTADVKTDLLLALGLPDKQVKQAAAFYQDIKQQYGAAYGDNIVFTGHSLGGGLAALMSVFFDKSAVTFDPAPFRLSATGAMKRALEDYLGDQGYPPDGDLAGFTTTETFLATQMPTLVAAIGGPLAVRFPQLAIRLALKKFPTSIRGEENVTAIAAAGEFLTSGFGNYSAPALDELRIYGPAIEVVGHGGVESVSGGQLHSINFLTALKTEPSLAVLSQQLPELTKMLFDESLYARQSGDEATDVFVRLLNNNSSSADSNTLGKFAADLQKLVGSSGLAQGSASIRDALIVAAIEYYYFKDPQFASAFFSLVNGGVHFNYDDIGTTEEYKSPTELKGALASMLTPAEQSLIDDIDAQRAWHIQSGTEALIWTASGTQDDAAIGGNGSDTLSGGGGDDVLMGWIGDDILVGGDDNDVLIASVGDDVLDGGAGNDHLSGGADNDTLSGGSGVDTLDGGTGTDVYTVEAAFGNLVTIRDADGVGSITVQGSSGAYLLKDGLESVPGTPGAWHNANGDLWSLAGATVIVQLAGGGYILLEDFADGNFGINFPGPVAAVPPTVFVPAANYYADASGPHNGLQWGSAYQTYYRSPAIFNESLIGPENIDISAAVPAEGLTYQAAIGGMGDSRIVGSAYNDILRDDLFFDGADFFLVSEASGDDVLIGGAGNDVLEANGGDDELYGGEGNDVLGDTPFPLGQYADVSWVHTPGHSSNDWMYGEGGDDTIFGAGGSAYMDGGQGADELFGGQDGDVLLGGSEADVLSGDTRLNDGIYIFGLDAGQDPTFVNNGAYVEDVLNPGVDTLVGGDGNDILLGGGKADVLSGGEGDDSLQGDTVFVPGGTRSLFSNHGTTPIEMHGADVLLGEAGNDTLYGGAGGDELYGGDDNDILFGEDNPQRAGSVALANPGDDLLDGGSGDDTMFGNGGADRLLGGDGVDQVYAGRGNDYIEGGAGADYLVGDDVGDTDPLNDGTDEIHGGEDDDQIFGLGGNDRLFGDGGADQIVGGTGNDTLEGGDGNDLLFGEEGDDHLSGGPGRDQLQGGAGNDTLEAGAGDASLGGDILFGEAGDDSFVLSSGSRNVQITDTEGSNRIVFGAGVDASSVTVSMSNGLVFIDFSPTDYAFMGAATFEHLTGFEFGDGSTMSTEEVRELFAPGPVQDAQLSLTSGVSAGDVTFYRRNDDLLMSYSGPVEDWVDTSTLNGRDVLFQEGSGTAFGLSPDDKVLVLDGWYRADPDTYVNQLVDAGSNSTNFVAAAMTADGLVAGDASANYLPGTDSRDIVIGGAGADVLDGQGGNDDLTGGTEDDALLGGAGSDVYRFNVGDGADLVLDQAGTDDRIAFGAGITTASLTVTESSTGLEVQVGAAANGDSLAILDWSQGSAGSIDRFVFDDGTSLDRAQIDALNTGNHSPRVAATIGEQLARIEQAFSYAVPAGTFTDQDAGDTLTYSAVQADGQPLPAWLTFNPSTRTFAGTPAAGDAGIVPILLQVTDAGGLANSVEFDIRATSAIVLTGTSSSNTLTATTAADYEIYGLGGNDTLTGNVGNDRLDGGTGNDTLNAAAGSDTYVYARGDGSDTINQSDTSAGKVDTLLFRTGIVASDLVFGSETDGDLRIFVRNTDGTLPATPSITVAGALIAETNERKLDRIVFEGDATVLTLAQIEQLAMTATENADYVRGSASADALNGLGGDDYLFGLGGNDTLTGGLGSDQMTGGTGSDTYVVNRGDGFDVITNNLDSDPASIDVLRFGLGVLPADVKVVRNDTLLSLQIYDPMSGAQINGVSVASGFDEALGSQALDEVRFADAPGVVWSLADLQALSMTSTQDADTIVGFGAAEVIDGQGGDDTLRGGGGDDVLIGGAGNDQLLGESGNDTYRFGRGQGHDEIFDSEGTNRIVLDAGIATSAVTLYRTPSEQRTLDDLVLVLDDGGEQIRIEEFYNGQTPRSIAEIVFSDGTVWNAADIDSRVIDLSGTPDTQTGGNNNTTFTVDHPDDVIIESAGGGVDTVFSSVSYNVPFNVENLILTGHFHINAFGSEANQTITGNAFDNLLQGYGGTDELIGGGGNDRFLQFNDGFTDIFRGGAGDDTYFVTREAENPHLTPNDEVYEDPNSGYDTVHAVTFEYTMPNNVEALIIVGAAGSPSSIIDIGGNASDNYIDARFAEHGSGVIIDGGAGADTIFVVNGAVNRVVVDNVGDVVNGADADDTIVSSISYTLTAGGNLELTGSAGISGTGSAQANQINGSTNSGANVLSGGAGNDNYTIDAQDVVVEVAGEGSDTVTVTFGNVHSVQSYANVENLAATDAAGAVTLNGASGSNSLTGNASANILNGAAGDDILSGGSGNDRYVGFAVGSGHDVVNDGAGADSIEFDGASNTTIDQLAISRTGNDLVIAGDAQSSVRVQSWFSGTNGANVVESLVLHNSGLAYSYTGQQLEAAANGVNGGPAVSGATADQTINLGVPFSFQLAANAFSDVESQGSLTYSATLGDGSALPSWLTFDSGTRTFSGTPSMGDAGLLTLRITAMDAGGLSATDDFVLDVGNVRRLGTAGDDTVTGGAGIEWIYGLDGHDTIDGQGGDDYLSGDAGEDSLVGAAGEDVLLGGAGGDVLVGGADADRLEGGVGNDAYVVDAASGHDTVVETDGVDRIEFANGSGITLSSLAASRSGDDLILAFGPNSVTVSDHYAGASSRVEEFATWQSGVQYVYSAAQIEALVAGTNSAPYVGTPLRNVAAKANVTWTYQVPAHTLTDTQSQGSLTYSARLVGGAALPSWLSFNASTRTLSGKPPNNTNLDYAIEIVGTDSSGLLTAAPFTLHVRTGLTTWTGTASADTNSGGSGVDYQLGLGGNDTLSGNNGNDIQDGGDGNDVLNGLVGDDIAYGGSGHDTIDGGDGNDALNGEAGRDTLTGGIGNDTLRGGAGADTLTGGIGADSMMGGDGADLYRHASGDGIDTIDNASSDAELDRLDFTNIARTQLTFTRSGNDLVMTRTGSDSVRVTNWFVAPTNRIDEILTSDGQTTTADQIDALIAGGGGMFSSAVASELPQSTGEVLQESTGGPSDHEEVLNSHGQAAPAAQVDAPIADEGGILGGMVVGDPPNEFRQGSAILGTQFDSSVLQIDPRVFARGRRASLPDMDVWVDPRARDDRSIGRSLEQLVSAMASFNSPDSVEELNAWNRPIEARTHELFGCSSRYSIR